MVVPVEITDGIIKTGFPKRKNVDPRKLKITDEAIYSISGNTRSLFITKLIAKHFGTYDLTVTDCTANVGSDTIQFGLHFSKVNSIEYNDVNFEALKHNVNMYGLDNVNLIKGDSTKIINELNTDVIYIDAPWDGRDYKKNKCKSLYLSGIELRHIYNKFKRKAKLFVFKVPNNYDFNSFTSDISDTIRIYSYMSTTTNTSRFKLIFVSKK